jgi:hypothetical protein
MVLQVILCGSTMPPVVVTVTVTMSTRVVALVAALVVALAAAPTTLEIVTWVTVLGAKSVVIQITWSGTTGTGTMAAAKRKRSPPQPLQLHHLTPSTRTGTLTRALLITSPMI